MDGALRTPAGAQLPEGLNSVLAAQILFPLLARTEMAGDPEENEIGAAAQNNAREAWRLIAARVTANAEYREIFDAVYGGGKYDISHVVNALAAFVDVDFRAQNTAFDRYVSGDETALNDVQINGLQLFYGDAECSACHSGSLFSDQSFHSIGLPQFGPGMTRRFDPVARDVGRMAVLGVVSAFGNCIRNVTLTGPYGHNGAYATLESIVRHHLSPLKSLQQWEPKHANLPDVPWVSQIDFLVHDDKREMARIKSSVDIKPMTLADNEIDDLLAFLTALEGKRADELPLGRPGLRRWTDLLRPLIYVGECCLGGRIAAVCSIRDCLDRLFSLT